MSVCACCCCCCCQLSAARKCNWLKLLAWVWFVVVVVVSWTLRESNNTRWELFLVVVVVIFVDLISPISRLLTHTEECSEKNWNELSLWVHAFQANTHTQHKQKLAADLIEPSNRFSARAFLFLFLLVRSQLCLSSNLRFDLVVVVWAKNHKQRRLCSCCLSAALIPAGSFTSSWSRSFGR